MIYYYSFLAISNFLIFIFFNQLTKKINLYDYPDKVRKFHRKPVPLIGGFLFFFNFSLYLIFSLTFFKQLPISFLHIYSIHQLIMLFFSISAFFCLGLYDDKFSLSPNIKLICSFIIVYLTLEVDAGLVVEELRFKFSDNVFYLSNTKLLFTTFCVLLFLNALNMYDGINLQSAIYFSTLYIILFSNNVMPHATLTILVSLLIFIYFNFREKTYLGDSGSFLLSFLTAYIFIKTYNYNRTFFADEIFLYMLLPGIDLLRMFIERLLNGQHPFTPDRRHLHFLLLDRFGYKKTILTTTFILISPILFYHFIFNNILIAISLLLIIYLFLLSFVKYVKN